MVVWYSDHHLRICPVFKWWSEYRTKFGPVFKWHSNNGPFCDWKTFDHVNPGLVGYSDPHCTYLYWATIQPVLKILITYIMLGSQTYINFHNKLTGLVLSRGTKVKIVPSIQNNNGLLIEYWCSPKEIHQSSNTQKRKFCFVVRVAAALGERKNYASGTFSKNCRDGNECDNSHTTLSGTLSQ